MSKIKVQSNASGTGVFTVTSPATNTNRTITLPDGTGTLLNSDGDGSNLTGTADATKLPLAGGTMTGALINTHTGGISVDSTSHAYMNINSSATNRASWLVFKQGGTGRWLAGVEGSETAWQLYDSGGNGTTFKVCQDGRGLSQFTAKAWVNFNGTGTLSVRDSHNISSVGDSGTGYYVISFANDMGNANYSAVTTAGGTPGMPLVKSPLSNASFGAGSFRVETLNAATGNQSAFDTAYILSVVFGD